MALLAAVVLLAVGALGQTLDDADRLAGSSQWKEAAAAYRRITETIPADGRAWSGLGESELQQGHYDAAQQAFQHAIELKYRPLVNQVNLARTFARGGEHAKALAILREIAQSQNAGRVRPIVLSSSEFDTMKSSAEFQQVLASMAPCRKPEYRQFDFWVGDWKVEDPAGHPVGHNLVTLEQDGCLIVEHWTSASGGQTGTSFNYWDLRDSKWHQLYLDNSGNAGAFPAMAGNLVDNKMVLLSDPSASPLFRWSWYVTGPGRVRQMAEQSTDSGKSWQIFWDSTYVKKP